HIDNLEKISVGLEREIYEETGVRARFESIMSMSHFYPAQFGESNLYIVCKGKALSKEIEIQDSHEIIEARWLDIEEFFEDEEIHEYNKLIVKNAKEKRGFNLSPKQFFGDNCSGFELFT
ncbi:MAG: NUDIX domain-containing protein, partial [Campylobacterales bacterium]|nr:NUDIX domain-containing protein [Campylobacterales bacterium]